MSRALLNLLPSSTVARLLVLLAAVTAALVLSLHFAEGPEGRADSPLGDLWFSGLALAAAVVVEVVSRRKRNP